MNDQKLLKNGLIGSGIAAVCCFTPALVVLVGFVGLSSIVGWLDYGLFPLLFASMGVVAYAFYLQTGRPGPAPLVPIALGVIGLSVLLFWLEFAYALRISIAAAVAIAVYVFYLRRARRLAAVERVEGT
jgi:hypothetical protein